MAKCEVCKDTKICQKCKGKGCSNCAVWNSTLAVWRGDKPGVCRACR